MSVCICDRACRVSPVPLRRPSRSVRLCVCVQGLVQRFTSAFEETKQELQAMTDDLEHSLSLTLAAKLNSTELPQRLQDANLVTRTTMAAHLKQVSMRPDLQLFANAAGRVVMLTSLHQQYCTWSPAPLWLHTSTGSVSGPACSSLLTICGELL